LLTKDIESTKYQSFSEFKLEESILLALAQKGYEKPTPIQ
jgi:superfamily II DNA/RNA helicase